MTSFAAHLALAETFCRAGNFAAARVHVVQALSMQPDSVEAEVQSWDVEVRSGDYKAALCIAERLVARLPSNPDVMLLHGLSLISCGTKKEAQRAIDRFAEAAPTQVKRVDFLRLCYKRKFGTADGILKAVSEMRSKHGDEAHYDSAELVQLTRKRNGARLLPLAAKVLAERPDEPTAHFAISIYGLHTGRFAVARHHARLYMRLKAEARPRGSEILFASYVGMLPPFLLIHQINCILNPGAAIRGGPEAQGHYLLTLLGFVGVSWLCLTAYGLMGPGVIQTSVAWLFAIWSLYIWGFFPEGHRRLRRKSRPTRLRADY